MSVQNTDVVIVGAGVVGLALARQFAQLGREVIVLEAATAIGTETSARNSEVIHAGIYYPTGSLKAALCVRGRQLLYDYCARKGVTAKRCGKLIVATDASQQTKLQALLEQARQNGCDEMILLSAAQAQAMEPALHCTAALYSPMTGILDSHGYMLALQGDAETAGATIAFGSPLLTGRCDADGILLNIGGVEPMQLKAQCLVNSAGLRAPELARRIIGLDQAAIPPAYFAKGNYFSLRGPAPFSRLIYPIPEPGGLGVHLTLDLGGQARFGPDVEWLDPHDGPLDYAVGPSRGSSFYAEIRRYWPQLKDDALDPAYSGIRPKIVPAHAPAADFLLSGPAQSGSRHYIGLYGIESPGLTASLAIAEYVARLAGHEDC